MRTLHRPLVGLLAGAVLASTVLFSVGSPTPVAAQGPSAAAKNDTPKWEVLTAAYDYEKTPQGKPLAVKEEARDEERFEGQTFPLTHLTFTNGQGHTVTGLFLKPKGDGPFPLVLLLHGLGSDKETMEKAFGRYLANRGIAVLALDAAMHGERREADQGPIAGPTFFRVMKETLTDWRLALDWATARKDVDTKQIGLFGYSMGAMMGSILGPVDPRIGAAVLCVGGDPVVSSLDGLPPAARALGETVSPSLYVGHFAPRPLLMVNAKDDRIMPREASERLQDAARQPKTIRWAKSGHILPPEETRDAMNWLAEKVGRK